jgi:hypothetical protein
VIIPGVVGLAGNARVRRADKRLFYAKYPTELRRLNELRPSKFSSVPEEEIERLNEQIEARKTAWATGEEIALIAPHQVMMLTLS